MSTTNDETAALEKRIAALEREARQHWHTLPGPPDGTGLPTSLAVTVDQLAALEEQPLPNNCVIIDAGGRTVLELAHDMGLVQYVATPLHPMGQTPQELQASDIARMRGNPQPVADDAAVEALWRLWADEHGEPGWHDLCFAEQWGWFAKQIRAGKVPGIEATAYWQAVANNCRGE